MGGETVVGEDCVERVVLKTELEQVYCHHIHLPQSSGYQLGCAGICMEIGKAM